MMVAVEWLRAACIEWGALPTPPVLRGPRTFIPEAPMRCPLARAWSRCEPSGVPHRQPLRMFEPGAVPHDVTLEWSVSRRLAACRRAQPRDLPPRSLGRTDRGGLPANSFAGN